MRTISMLDFSPQTFTLSLDMTVMDENAPQPGPGTYQIGSDSSNPGSPFFNATLTLIENEDFANAVEYHTYVTGGGTLTITTSNEDELSGSMDFTADEYDDTLNKVGTVDVIGSFSAVPQ